jgi:pentatricopeptide repeat protein
LENFNKKKLKEANLQQPQLIENAGDLIIELAVMLLLLRSTIVRSLLPVKANASVEPFTTSVRAYQSDATENAEQVFQAIRSPNTSAYNKLINAYAQKGDAKNAFTIFQQMRQDFDSGNSKQCRPDVRTYNTLLNALQKSNRSDALEKAEQFFNAIRSPNTVTYTTLLNIYARNGEIDKALNLFQQMQSNYDSGNKDCRPNMHTYATILNALHKSNRSDAAVKAELFFNSIPSPDTVAYSTLLNIYAYNENIDKALKLFKQMQLDFESGKNKNCRPNLHTYNTILNALQKSNRSDAAEKAEQFFKSIPSPDTVTYNTLLNIHAQTGEIDKALILVQQMRMDFDSGKNKDCRPDMHTYATILNALQKSSRSDALEKAELFFDLIPSPNTVTYTTLLNIYAQNGEIDKALNLVQHMQSDYDSGNKDCRPNMHTYATILNALHKLNRSDAAEKAELFFNAIPSPDTVTYNTLLNIYAHYGNIDKALNLVQQMQMDFDSGKNKDCRPDMHTYNTILNALQNLNRSDAAAKAKQFFNLIPSPNTVTYNTLLNMYAHKGEIEEALNLVQQMQIDFDSGKNKNCRPNLRTYTTILNALLKSNRSDALEKAEQFCNAIPSPNTVTYTTLLNVYAQNGEIEKVLNLFQQMQSDYESGNKDCRPNMHTYATFLNALQKSNRSDAAAKAELSFSSIPSPNTVTYNTLLNIYAQNGEFDKALNLVQQMQSDYDSGNKDCRPGMRTYNTILKAFQNSNRSDAAAIAEQFFNSIPSPNTVTYTTLLNLYAEKKLGRKAIRLARRMQVAFDSGRNTSCMPNVVTKTTILKALRITANSDLENEAQDVLEWFRRRSI